MRLTIKVGRKKEDRQTGSLIKACNMLADKMSKSTHLKYHTQIKLSSGKSNGSDYAYLNILKALKVLEITEKDYFEIFGENEGTPATYCVNKNRFCILLPLLLMLDSLSTYQTKYVRSKLIGEKQDIDLQYLLKTIEDTVNKDMDLPTYGQVAVLQSNTENDVSFYNTIFKLFFDGLLEFTNTHKYLFNGCYYWNNLPLFRYALKDTLADKIKNTYGFISNSLFFPSLSLLTVHRFWENIPESLLTNNSRINAVDEKTKDGYKISWDKLIELEEPDIPQEIKSIIESNINTKTLDVVSIFNNELNNYLSISHTHSKVATYIIWYAFKKSVLIQHLCLASLKLTKLKYKFVLNFSIHINGVRAQGRKGYSFKITTRQTSPFTLEHKEQRLNVLKMNWGNSTSYDFSSCSFMITRLLNKGDFSIGWSLKDIIVNSGIDKIDGGKLVHLKRSDLSQLPYRLFNHTNGDYIEYFKEAYLNEIGKRANNPYYIVEMPNLPEESINRIVQITYDECGDWHHLRNVIYFLESLLELSIIYGMVSNKKPVENVFDEFFFNPKTTTKKEFNKLVEDTTKAFLKWTTKNLPELISTTNNIELGIINKNDDSLVLHYLFENMINHMSNGKIFFSKEHQVEYYDDEGVVHLVDLNEAFASNARKRLTEVAAIKLIYDKDSKRRYYQVQWQFVEWFITDCYMRHVLTFQNMQFFKRTLVRFFPNEYNTYFSSFLWNNN